MTAIFKQRKYHLSYLHFQSTERKRTKQSDADVFFPYSRCLCMPDNGREAMIQAQHFCQLSRMQHWVNAVIQLSPDVQS